MQRSASIRAGRAAAPACSPARSPGSASRARSTRSRASGPCILAPNHASNADPVVVGAWLTPPLGRRIHWLGKKEVFEWPVIGWMGRHGGVHRSTAATADVEGFRTAMRVLEAGHVLLVFPEGTRSPDGALQEAKDGVAMLALRERRADRADRHRRQRPRLAARAKPPAARRPRSPSGSGEPFRLADVLPADVRSAARPRALATRQR